MHTNFSNITNIAGVCIVQSCLLQYSETLCCTVNIQCAAPIKRCGCLDCVVDTMVPETCRALSFFFECQDRSYHLNLVYSLKDTSRERYVVRRLLLPRFSHCLIVSMDDLSKSFSTKEKIVLPLWYHKLHETRSSFAVMDAMIRQRSTDIASALRAQVTNTHVGMLVCGIFNASVASESMGEGFTYDMIAREWRGAEGQVIAVGGDTRFVVTR